MKKRFICIVPILLMLAALFAAVPAFAAETPQVRLMGDAQAPVTPIDVSDIAYVEFNTRCLYTGEGVKPKVTVTVDDVPLTEGVDFTCTYENNVNLGDYAIVYVHFIGNYTGSMGSYFTILTPWKAIGMAFSGYDLPAGGEDYMTFSVVDNAYTVKLLRDIELTSSDETLKLSSFSKTCVLDLNGHTVNANGKRLFFVDGGKLVITDSSEKGAGTICGCYSYQGGGAVRVERNGTFALAGGVIAGAYSNEGGGAVRIQSGSFTMSGGKISQCYAYSSGGAVYIDSDCEFTMTGGEITENEAMNNSYGGGVYVSGSGDFTMTGGSITKNTTLYGNNYGGGVYCGNSATIGGTAVISGNLRSPENSRIPDDLYVRNPLTIPDGENAPKQGMNVGVTLYNSAQPGCGAFTGECADLTSFFFVDDPCRKLVYADGRMQIIPKPTSVTLGDGTVTVAYVSLFDEVQVSFCVAAYDQNGKMLGITYETVEVSAGMNEVTLDLPGKSPEKYVVFTLDGSSCVSLGSSIPIQGSAAE